LSEGSFLSHDSLFPSLKWLLFNINLVVFLVRKRDSQIDGLKSWFKPSLLLCEHCLNLFFGFGSTLGVLFKLIEFTFVLFSFGDKSFLLLSQLFFLNVKVEHLLVVRRNFFLEFVLILVPFFQVLFSSFIVRVQDSRSSFRCTFVFPLHFKS